MKRLVFVSLLSFSLYTLSAQDWLRDMHDPRVNFFEVQHEFNNWWAVNGPQVLRNAAIKGKGEKEGTWKLYKSWEQQMLPLMTRTNGLRLGASNESEKQFYRTRMMGGALRITPTWSYIGPMHSFDDGTGDSSCGRVNCVRFDPADPHIIYCGAPTGGLWKSVDFGGSWQLLNTDFLPQIGLSDVAVNYLNTNTLYVGTGDIANYACHSIGVLKSVDGGHTWDTTGLSFTITQGIEIARLLMSPEDTNTLYAATNTGIYKTINGGRNWALVNTYYGYTGMEFNPLNPSTIYAWGTVLYRSVDAGASWAPITNGLPTSSMSDGIAVGLTPADTNCIYVMACAVPSPGVPYTPFNGVYRSLDNGTTFTRRCVNPDPSNTGNQGQYDLNIAVSPLNENYVVMGAVQSAVSTDGGQTWANPVNASHVDHHDIRFWNGSQDTVFSADDGGLFLSTDGGQNWSGLNNGMHIGQLYNVSSSTQSYNLFLTGRQDEGTLIQDTSFENLLAGGDGLECLIDPFNQNDLFGSDEEGVLGNSTSGGSNINILTTNFGSGVNGYGAWNTPYALGPHNPQTIYIGKDYVYESNDGGSSWNQLGFPDLAGSGYYLFLVVSPKDTNFMYAAGNHKLYASYDGGATYSDVTGSFTGRFTSLAVSPENPLEIWVGVASGSSHVLYRSVDGGATFTPLDNGLPVSTAFYPLSIAPVRNSANGLYCSLANAGGVYYRDDNLGTWVNWSAGLPNVSVDQIEVDYFANKIRAATYGRDLWESAPYLPFAASPTAMASWSYSGAPCADTIVFTDHSNYSPTFWQWYFPGGQPVASTAQNPRVVFPPSGTYTVTFITGNANGSDTVSYNLTSPACNAISALTEGDALRVYPNPGNGLFEIELSGPGRGDLDMLITDNLGRTVLHHSADKESDGYSGYCHLENFEAGIYYLHLYCAGAVSTAKLIICVAAQP